ncbi:acyl-CoA reductase [uncultured Clostridium sp.]|uniref:acyl-CoA reductase n=1 Tax=uncultured Clostridium sp. TaxID=59620 RepID=UPI0028E3F68C|nr:acyl-CoA reductase [uncultured Clostridium sp.]
MIKCYTLNGEFFREGLEFNNFDNIYEILKENENRLKNIPVDAILQLINEYSATISKRRDLLIKEGVPFLSFYLKKNNLDKVINLNISNKYFLDKFIEVDEKKFIKAQKRGIVCHWIAGNIPTLGIYSIFQSIICRNSNIVKIPLKNEDIIIELLKPLKDIKINFEGTQYYGLDILINICIINFSSKDMDLNLKMSKIADCRVFWGGEEALRQIRKLPQKTTCKDIIFGPKYSFAAFDKEVIESNDLEKYLENLTLDIITFNQEACSSPHVLFLEKSLISIEEVSHRLIKAFEKMSKRYSINHVDEGIAASIINKRGEYALSLEKMIHCSKGLEYTILISDEFKLEEPVGGRTIFLKEVQNISEVKNLITPKIQTVGIAFKNEEKALVFADEITNRGVDRVVKVGYMSLFDTPWDGLLTISELVRWCSININGMIE